MRLWGVVAGYGGGLRWRVMVAVYGGGLRTLFMVYGVRVPKTKIGYGVRLPKTGAESFEREVTKKHRKSENFYTGDFEIAPSNTLFRCILRCTPCVRVLGYRIMFPST